MLLRQSALYMSANIAAAVIGFTSVMVLTRLVAPTDYGVFVVAVGIGNVCATLLFTWLRHAILRFQSQPGADVRLSALTGYGLTLLAYPIALAILLAVFKFPLNKAAAAVAFAGAIALFELGQEIQRARQQVRGYVSSTVVRSGLSLVFCFAAVLFGGGGLALVVAMAAGYVAAALLQAPRVWAAPRSPPDCETLLRLARYGVPITVSGAFVALSLTLDRFALYALLGTDAVGVYGATADFVRQCAILPAVSASLAIAPLAVSALERRNGAGTAKHLGDGLELLLAVMLPAVVGLAIAAPQVAGVILGPEYRQSAVGLMPIIAVAVLAHTLSQQYVQLSFGLANKPHLYIVHTGLIFLINLILMVPMIRLFGLGGAALSFLLAETAGVGIGLWMSRFAFALPLVPRRLFRIIAAVTVMAAMTLSMRALLGRSDMIGLVTMLATGTVSYAFAVLVFDAVGARRHLAAILSLRTQRRVPHMARP